MKKFLLTTALIVISMSTTAFAEDKANSLNSETYFNNGIIKVQGTYNNSCNVIKPTEVTTKNCNFNKPIETTTKNCFEYTTQIVIKPICTTTESTTQTVTKPTYTTTEITTQAVVKPTVTTTEATTETTTQAVVKPTVTTTEATTETTTQKVTVTETSTETTTSATDNNMARQLLTLVNKARAENGLSALTLNDSLSNVAQKKADDMKNNNYFSHTSPTYGSPFDMIKNAGISYKAAGENIAKGQKTAEAVFNAWMNSSGHRANILNSQFTQMGVGVTSGTTYWSQMFIG